MKRLYLMRHAKSSWGDPGLADAERPLNKRGKHDAPMMGKRLATRGYVPDLIVSSPAVRALTTARLVARELAYPRDAIRREQALYLAEPERLLEVIGATDDSAASLMLFGHNPGFTDLANALTPDTRIANLPTSGVFCADFDIAHWQALRPRTGRLVCFDYPKNRAD